MYRQGNVLSFGKPSFEELLVSHSIEIDSKKDISSTLVAFGGSDRVGAKIKESTVFHDIWLAQFGLLQHHYEVQAMSIAGLYNKAKRRKAPLNINSRKKEYSKRKGSSGGHLWDMHWESALVREIVSSHSLLVLYKFILPIESYTLFSLAKSTLEQQFPRPRDRKQTPSTPSSSSPEPNFYYWEESH